MYRVTVRDDIRYYVLVQGHSQRQAARHYGVSRDTVSRMLREPAEEPERKYKPIERATPARDAVMPHIEQWLAENEQLGPRGRKQQWTAHRMWVELRRVHGETPGTSTQA